MAMLVKRLEAITVISWELHCDSLCRPVQSTCDYLKLNGQFVTVQRTKLSGKAKTQTIISKLKSKRRYVMLYEY